MRLERGSDDARIVVSLRVLRQKYSASRLPVITVTAQAESDNVVAALQQGANDYITKPVDLKVALSKTLVKEFVQHRRSCIGSALGAAPVTPVRVEV